MTACSCVSVLQFLDAGAGPDERLIALLSATIRDR